MQEEEREAGSSRGRSDDEDNFDSGVPGSAHVRECRALRRGSQDGSDHPDAEDVLNEDVGRNDGLNRKTLWKLDTILLPFLSILFLLNSLDKSNIGNAESAGFTHDAGLDQEDVNVAMACFFAFFVALQPIGAALGRRYGMARWVPACMSLWGLSTILHLWVRSRWQLIALRILIASLEAGFYPTTVSYLSLFYTRYEFAVRLGFFYGQSAVAGALGGVLAWAVFSSFPTAPGAPQPGPPSDTAVLSGSSLKGWQILFLIEGCMTIFIALVGFLWLPHSADAAWFLSAEERKWAEQRIRLDRESAATPEHHQQRPHQTSTDHAEEIVRGRSSDVHAEGSDEAHEYLLSEHGSSPSTRRKASIGSAMSITADTGLSRHDVVSAFVQFKIWHLLVCNILSAIPATAFGIFLPVVIKQMSPSLSLSPAASNLLTAPPFAFGAVTLFFFTRWSDRSHKRLVPILWGLGILLIGLITSVLIPMGNYVLRYLSLCVLLSGSFVASPLTVAWISDNTPETGKRAVLLGINGWGNLAGVSSAFLFTPDDAQDGYVKSFVVTLMCVLASFAGYVAFVMILNSENQRRGKTVAQWSESQKQREEVIGDVDLHSATVHTFFHKFHLHEWSRLLGVDGVRRGDERLTYRYTF